MSIITIDGSQGEGGGQILRSALSLSAITGKPFVIENIRARRAKPGLMRQHLTAVKAAAEICGASVGGAEVGSARLRFEPRAVRTGNYTFNIGSAGSTTLVLQTVMLPLALAGGTSRIVLQGGTHNMSAPPFEFLVRAFLPLVRRIGFDVRAELHRPGFYPAGGGEIEVVIGEPMALSPLVIEGRGKMLSRTAEALLANLPFHIAERELAHLGHKHGWPEDSLIPRTERHAQGPGNCVLLTMAFEHVSEVATGFGRAGVAAETVADEAASAMTDYLATLAPVGEHLADQLLLPMALAAGGRFVAGKPSPHTLTNIGVIQRFLGIEIDAAACGPVWKVTVGKIGEAVPRKLD